MKRVCLFFLLLFAAAILHGATPADLDFILKNVQKAMKSGDNQSALDLSTDAIKRFPTNATALFVRAKVLSDLGMTKEAIPAYDAAIAAAPLNAESYQDRGLNLFKSGKVKESLADFNKYLAMVPRAAPYHWQRGLACYYAEQYDEGRRQFELHAEVNRADVEVATWHFACVARLKGIEQARANLLPVGEDARIPLMEIYRFYQGKSTVEKVLAAAHSAPAAREQDAVFYAYLYLALYHEVNGEQLLALNEIKTALKKAPLNDYMADTAFVHRDLREKEQPTMKPVVPIQGIKRGGLGNFFEKVKKGEEVKVAYFGGSITAAQGWRVKTMEWFKKQYPAAKFSEINAAIGGTGSDLGVYRFRHDVLDLKPDLVFVEFAVNDAGASPTNIWKALEGVVLQAWDQNPKIDFCMVYTFTTNLQGEYDKINAPRSVAADELFADYYGIPSINVSIETARLIRDKKMVPKADAAEVDGLPVFSKDGVHPGDRGHAIYTDIVTSELLEMEKGAAEPILHSIGRPYIAGNWKEAKMLPVTGARLSEGWSTLDVTNELSKKFSNRFTTIKESRKPGETLAFKFKGTAARIYDIMGPDSGKVSVQVDGKSPFIVSRFDSFCTYHRLNTFSVAENLPNELHEVKIIFLEEKPDKSAVMDKEKEKAGFDAARYEGATFRPGAILVVGDLVP